MHVVYFAYVLSAIQAGLDSPPPCNHSIANHHHSISKMPRIDPPGLPPFHFQVRICVTLPWPGLEELHLWHELFCLTAHADFDIAVSPKLSANSTQMYFNESCRDQQFQSGFSKAQDWTLCIIEVEKPAILQPRPAITCPQLHLKEKNNTSNVRLTVRHGGGDDHVQDLRLLGIYSLVRDNAQQRNVFLPRME